MACWRFGGQRFRHSGYRGRPAPRRGVRRFYWSISRKSPLIGASLLLRSSPSAKTMWGAAGFRHSSPAIGRLGGGRADGGSSVVPGSGSSGGHPCLPAVTQDALGLLEHCPCLHWGNTTDGFWQGNLLGSPGLPFVIPSYHIIGRFSSLSATRGPCRICVPGNLSY